uniref:Secreted protein n=1 Tax=Parascaris univalens TaxID=6257 RepID=A0A914ZXT3_PARUN
MICPRHLMSVKGSHSCILLIVGSVSGHREEGFDVTRSTSLCFAAKRGKSFHATHQRAICNTFRAFLLAHTKGDNCILFALLQRALNSPHNPPALRHHFLCLVECSTERISPNSDP